MISDRTRFGLAAIPFFGIAVTVGVGAIAVPHGAALWTVLIACALGVMFAGVAMSRRELRAAMRTTGAWRRTDPPLRLVRPRRNIADRDRRLLSEGRSVMTSASWQDDTGRWRLVHLVLQPGSPAMVSAAPLARGQSGGTTITGPLEVTPLVDLPPAGFRRARGCRLRIVGANQARMEVTVPQVDAHLFEVLASAPTP